MSGLIRIKIPDVTEKLLRDSVGRSLSSNLVYTIWAVFGGFILHFLLSNYLTVLLRPSYEQPVETSKDLIDRDLIPFYIPGGDLFKQFFANSRDPNLLEISRRLVIPKDWDEHDDLSRKAISTGLFSKLGTEPPTGEDKKGWYRSSEAIVGTNPYGGHLENKKWPLKKVMFDHFFNLNRFSILLNF